MAALEERQDGRRSASRVQRGHLVQCGAPVTVNLAVEQSPLHGDHTADARPQKRLPAAGRGRCSAKAAAVVVVGALLLAAAAALSLHLLRPGPPPPEDDAADRRTPPPQGAVRRLPTATTSQPLPSTSMTSLPDLSSSQASDICGPPQEILPPGQRVNDSDAPADDPRYYTQAQWGAKPPNKLVPMSYPIRYVVVSHTAQSRCRGLATCSPLLRSMQTYHLSRHYDDLAYSFLVADDGSVFEGRGWGRASSHLGSRGNTALGVGYLGDYRRYGLTRHQVSSTARLLEYGVRCGYLDHDYLLVAHNQTRLTESPGRFVVREISSWPHYSDVRLF